MKKIFTLLAAVFITATLWAQSPEKMSYQAVIRDGNDNLVTNQTIGMQISILHGSVTGTAVYVEYQTPTTNINGLVSLEIGSGTVLSGDFTSIDWAHGPFFIQTETETDPTGGTGNTIIGTSQLLSVPYALHAKTANNVKTYTVGDFAQGGIVFWVDQTGQHGLVAAKEDQSTGVRWYAGTNGNTQAKGDGPFAGKANTPIIIAAHVAIGDDGGTYAARICNELQVTEGGKTYGDWYLPSNEELNLMYQNKSVIDSAASANGGSAFAGTFYWNSTESLNNQDFAGNQYFSDGNQYFSLKSFSYRVRAVRAF